MPTKEVEEFARILVERVRDAAVRDCDGLLQPNAASPAAKRWRKTFQKPESLRTVIPDAVDEVVFSLLRAVDEGGLRLKFVSSSGKEIDLTEDGLGELAGWYMGSGGWRSMFSRERFADDFEELSQ